MRTEAPWVGTDCKSYYREKPEPDRYCENCGKGIDLDFDDYGKTEDGYFLCEKCWEEYEQKLTEEI